MKNNNKKKHQHNKKMTVKKYNIEYIDRAIFYGLIVCLLFIPLLVRGSVIDFVSPSISEVSAMTTRVGFEIYSHMRFIFLIIVSSIVTILFCYKVFALNYKIKPSIVNICIALFIM